jgi:hypothetical protein
VTFIEPEIDLGPVVDTLAMRFAAVADRVEIDELVSQTAGQFASARIREFVPVLVQHLCADRLRALAPS